MSPGPHALHAARCDAMRNNVKESPRFPYANRPPTLSLSLSLSRGRGLGYQANQGHHRGAKGVRVLAAQRRRDTPNRAKGESAKITVGNNAIDWEDELARALREMDNISLGRPLQGTIR